MASILPRGMSRDRASAYLRMRPATFDSCVANGRFPPPFSIGENIIWDRFKIDAVLDAEEEAKVGTIYVIGFDRYIKIGWSKGVAGRIRDLQTGTPRKLELLGSFSGTKEFERSLHARFREYRLEGEWFARKGKLSHWITRGCKP